MELELQLERDASSASGLFSREWRAISIGTIGLCSMIAFEAIGVAAGMPAVAQALHGMSWYPLAFSSTLATSVVAMVWSGRDCDRHGPYRSMRAGLLLFAAGLLCAGLAGSMATLIVGRSLQGLGIGALGVALYVAAARTLPERLHPRLFAMFSSAWVVPAVLGSTIAGWIVAQWGWRWLFLGCSLLLLPTALLMLPPLRRTQVTTHHAAPDRLMLPWSMVAAAASIGLSLSQVADRFAPLVVVAAIALMIGAAVRILPPGTMRLARGLPTAVALRGINAAAFFLCEAFIPLWLHQQRGWTILAAGLALTSGALSWSVGSHTQSRIEGGVRRRLWLRRGCLIQCIGIVICGVAVLGLIPDWILLIGWALAGLGVGLSLPMLGVLTLKVAPPAQKGVWSSALQLCSALGTSAALALGGVVYASLLGFTPTGAFVSVFGLAALLAGFSWCFVPRLPS